MTQCRPRPGRGYPQVFGGAAALSTHWVGRPSKWGTPDRLQNASLPLAAFQYLQVHLPKANTRRLYMDHGTTGLDAVYGVHQAVSTKSAVKRAMTQLIGKAAFLQVPDTPKPIGRPGWRFR